MTVQPFDLRPSRRALLGGAAAFGLGALSLKSARATGADFDVIVVGAGVAGIGAGLALKQAGVSFRILEAADRIGGRALTDTTFFRSADGKSAVPFDIGCAWIHAYHPGDPFADWSRKLNFDTQAHSLEVNRLFYGKTPFSSLMVEMVGQNETAFEDAFKKAGDVAASSVIKDWQRPMDAAATYMGPMDMGVDFDDMSTADFVAMADYEPNYLVREGYGTLIRRVGELGDLNVQLSTPVTAINTLDAGVEVATAGKHPGKLKAKAVIVTVSTGVLAANAIAFSNLPPATAQAIEDVPMGLLAKIPLQVPGIGHYLDGIGPYENILEQGGNGFTRDDIYFLAWPWDSDLMVGFVGGKFGWDMSQKALKDPRIPLDYARQKLGDLLGSGAAKHVKRGLMTPWATNRLTLGAYSAARPGKHASRAVLAQPVDGKLIFAGEATAPEGMFATASGAYMAGWAAADVAAKAAVKAG
jgi:monoamine oxidase